MYSSTMKAVDTMKLEQMIQNALNEDALVFVEEVIAKVDWKFVYALSILIPLLLVVIGCCWGVMTWHTRQKERDDVMLLLA